MELDWYSDKLKRVIDIHNPIEVYNIALDDLCAYLGFYYENENETE
jgi:hypothetical protein